MNGTPLQLVISVHDLRSGTTVEHVFNRFPVRVGRGMDCDLRLDAMGVSRRHGIFRHRAGSSVRYVDLHSTNGSYVDGRAVDPGKPVSLRDANVIRIGPCQLTFHVRQAVGEDDHTRTVVQRSPGPPPISLGGDVLVVSDGLGLVRSRHGVGDLWTHALEVIEVLAEVIVLYREPTTSSRSPLCASAAPDEIVAYLTAPEEKQHRLRELRHVLTEMCHPTTASSPGAQA